MVIAPVIFLTVVDRHRGMRELGGRARRRQGVRLFPGLLDAGADHRPDRRQCRPAGRGMNIDPATLDAKAVADYAQGARDHVTGFLMAIIPTTMVSALTEGSILQTCSSRSCSASRCRWSARRKARARPARPPGLSCSASSAS
jgi:aerobic C4-dicarboxylate transport protein